MRVFSLRAPSRWVGRLTSEQVRGWIGDYLRAPKPLPADPGPGDVFISLFLPERAVKVLSGLVDAPSSAALRRLIAAHIPTLPLSPPVVESLITKTTTTDADLAAASGWAFLASVAVGLIWWMVEKGTKSSAAPKIEVPTFKAWNPTGGA